MKNKVILILHNVRSVVNVGAIFRIADSAGVSKIYLTGYTPTPLDRFGNKRRDFHKSALGAEDYIEWEQHKGYSQVLKNMRISFYNDSASTNPHTTAAAIRAFPNAPTVLIAGGQDKGLNYAPLARALKHSTVKLVVLFGENKHKIAKTIKKTGVQLRLANNLHSAVKIATRFAVLLATRYSLPPIIIFSPGAASFDMFKNYADRGNKFKKIVKNLKAR